MLNPRLASRYAKSLLGLAIEKNQLENVYADMQWLQQLTKKSREFLNLLRSPVVKGDAKQKAINAVTKGKISTITIAFTKLLVDKGRESNLPEIITSFIRQYKEYKEIYVITLTTAATVSDKIKQAIVDQVKRTEGFENIELVEKVDESLIGGFVLQVGDKLVDASVAYDLKEVERQFENNDFIYKVR